MPLSVLTGVSKLVLQVTLVSIWLTALVPVTLVLLVIFNNNMLPLIRLTNPVVQLWAVQSFHHCLMALLQVIPVLQLVPLSRLKAFQHSIKLVLLVLVYCL